MSFELWNDMEDDYSMYNKDRDSTENEPWPVAALSQVTPFLVLTRLKACRSRNMAVQLFGHTRRLRCVCKNNGCLLWELNPNLRISTLCCSHVMRPMF